MNLRRIDKDEFSIPELLLKVNLTDKGTEIHRLSDSTDKLLALKDLIAIDSLKDNALLDFVLDKTASAVAAIDIIAQETIKPFDPVSIDGFIADSSNDKEVVALALTPMNPGEKRKCLTLGLLTNPSWNFLGKDVFLNGKTLSTTPANTGFVQRVGIAQHSTILFLKISEPIYKS